MNNNKATPEAEKQFYVVSLKHTHREHLYITFWRPDHCGYAWPLSWAGRYSESHVREHLDYLNCGYTVCVPCDVVDPLAVEPVKGYIDGNAGPVVPNNLENWKQLLAAVIEQPAEPYTPVYPGARGKSNQAYPTRTKTKTETKTSRSVEQPAAAAA